MPPKDVLILAAAAACVLAFVAAGLFRGVVLACLARLYYGVTGKTPWCMDEKLALAVASRFAESFVKSRGIPAEHRQRVVDAVRRMVHHSILDYAYRFAQTR